MIRRIATLALCASLAGCVSLPHLGKPTPTIAAAAPLPACPGGLRADLLPQPPVPAAAGFPAAQNDAESASVSAYLTWLHELAVWGRQGWARAADAKAYCGDKP